jgi:hypothetical protein
VQFEMKPITLCIPALTRALRFLVTCLLETHQYSQAELTARRVIIEEEVLGNMEISNVPEAVLKAADNDEDDEFVTAHRYDTPRARRPRPLAGASPRAQRLPAADYSGTRIPMTLGQLRRLGGAQKFPVFCVAGAYRLLGQALLGQHKYSEATAALRKARALYMMDERTFATLLTPRSLPSAPYLLSASLPSPLASRLCSRASSSCWSRSASCRPQRPRRSAPLPPPGRCRWHCRPLSRASCSHSSSARLTSPTFFVCFSARTS